MEPDDEPEAGRFPRGMVLLVEDDDDIREALADTLRDHGYLVTCVSNGREACQRLYTQPRPAVIILDLMMPIMNGWEFRVEQRRHSQWASIPVVVMTAHPTGAMWAKAEGLGFLRKPVSEAALLGAIRTFAG